jgi:hypothetical protein
MTISRSLRMWFGGSEPGEDEADVGPYPGSLRLPDQSSRFIPGKVHPLMDHRICLRADGKRLYVYYFFSPLYFRNVPITS